MGGRDLDKICSSSPSFASCICDAGNPTNGDCPDPDHVGFYIIKHIQWATPIVPIH